MRKLLKAALLDMCLFVIALMGAWFYSWFWGVPIEGGLATIALILAVFAITALIMDKNDDE